MRRLAYRWDNPDMESLRKILAERGRTQAWLADALGVTEATISRYASGRRPNTQVLRRMASLLHVEVEEITGEQPFMTDDERKSLEAFRRIPAEKLAAYWTLVDALAGRPQESTGLSDTPQPSLPDRKESD